MDYVFLHGTAQAAAGWQRLIDILEKHGHQAFTVDFPTDQPGLLADDYARIAADQVGAAARTPVVVAHSGAGMLLPAVAEAVGAGHLLWLAAAVPDFAGGTSLAGQLTTAASDIAGEEWRAFGRMDRPRAPRRRTHRVRRRPLPPRLAPPPSGRGVGTTPRRLCMRPES